MSFPRFYIGLFAVVMWGAALPAQDAKQIIESTERAYSGAVAYSAQVDSRTVYFVFAPTAEGTAPGYQVSNIQYRRLQLKVRRLYDYLLGAQVFMESPQGGAGAPMPGNFQAPTGGQQANWSYLSRTDSSLPKQGVMLGGRFTIKDVPAEQFTALVNSRLGYRSAEDVVLRYFQAQKNEGPSVPLMGLVEPALIGRETLNSRPMYRIVAKTADRNPIMLWIEQDTFLVARTIVQRPRSRVVPGGVGMPPMPAPGAPVLVTAVETFYNNQKLNPALSAADFTITDSSSNERVSAEQMGFGSIDDLVKLAEITPSKNADGSAGPNEEGDSTGVETPATPSATGSAGAAIEGQALTYEQMSGIVLVDGDGGTATGFMTKIRDVDFVVTNLHVLVGNKKFTLKNLRGEEIEPLGIYGAVGGDIAIIRVGKGQGDLRLAEDVFKTSKIGDKVVVVGNRRGGGVATQTGGSIKGIGPKLVEVDANFQSGNSGSPIVNLGTKEVIGVATYSETRRVEVDGGAAVAGAAGAAGATAVEKRWFGYRLDGVSKWEAIDLAKWNAQGERIEKFRDTSEALHAVIRFDFKTARRHPRLTALLDNFESRYRLANSNSITAAVEVKDLFRVIRTISDDGMRDLSTGDYYDYYRTCQYWENSIPAQLEYRKAIVEVLKRYEANSGAYLSRMRGN